MTFYLDPLPLVAGGRTEYCALAADIQAPSQQLFLLQENIFARWNFK